MIGLIGINHRTASVGVRERLALGPDEVRSCEYEALGDFFYSATGHRAVEDLLKVASGLEPMVLGENEILGRVKKAYRLIAFRFAKRVRPETGINKSPAPVMKRRHDRALLLIDLAVPRDIDGDAKRIHGAFLYDIDDLERVEECAKFIEGKYLGLVVRQLKALSKNGQRLEYIDMVHKLFDLPKVGQS